MSHPVFKLILSCLLISALVLPVLSLEANAPDISKIASGARFLGLGRAVCSLRSDASSTFTNPAGLADIEEPQITSMSGKLLGEFNYLSAAGIYPTKYGVFGLSYAGAQVGGSPTTTKIRVGELDRVIRDSRYSEMQYSHNEIIFSLSRKGSKRLAYGLNLKLLSEGLSGGPITNGTASGWESDLGFIFQSHEYLNWGLAFTNFLPDEIGYINYAAGRKEALPLKIKAGFNLQIFGEKALRKSKQDLFLALDIENEPSRKLPATFHLGAEWSPIELLSLRAGLDQNNLTAGVGLNHSKFRFDYAYHQFEGGLDDSHFFSLSYGIGKKKFTGPSLVIIVPNDKSLNFSDLLEVEIQVKNPDVKTVKVFEQTFKVEDSQNIRTQVSLPKLGKNSLWASAYDKDAKFVNAARVRVLNLISFKDVSRSYWGFEEIAIIGTLGIINGYPDGTFKPSGKITRAEMAALLVRAYQENQPEFKAEVKFTDIKNIHWASEYIKTAAAIGIVKGYPDKTFRPNSNITRAEGLAMIARFAQIEKEPYFNEFSDVNKKHWAAQIIAAANNAKMINTSSKTFTPNRALVRSEAVTMMYRTPYSKNLTANLLNFDSGYEESFLPVAQAK